MNEWTPKHGMHPATSHLPDRLMECKGCQSKVYIPTRLLQLCVEQPGKFGGNGIRHLPQCRYNMRYSGDMEPTGNVDALVTEPQIFACSGFAGRQVDEFAVL